MHSRKIQLIAGSSYTISLPKKWVQKSSLKEQDEVSISENVDGSLTIHPTRIISDVNRQLFRLDAEKFEKDILQVLFSVYYLGFEQIEVYSKKEMTSTMRSRVRGALRYMSGTEIIYESINKITFKVLLDKTKVDIHQLYYRMGLLIGTSIDLINSNKFTNEDLMRNEDEIDRLYQLISKIIFLAQADSVILSTSGINNVNYLISYLLIGKRLEQLADTLELVGEWILKNKTNIQKKDRTIVDEVFVMVKQIITSNMGYLMNRDRENRSFEKTDPAIFDQIENKFENLEESKLEWELRKIIRTVVDIEEELVSISFFSYLTKESTV